MCQTDHRFGFRLRCPLSSFQTCMLVNNAKSNPHFQLVNNYTAETKLNFLQWTGHRFTNFKLRTWSRFTKRSCIVQLMSCKQLIHLHYALKGSSSNVNSSWYSINYVMHLPNLLAHPLCKSLSNSRMTKRKQKSRETIKQGCMEKPLSGTRQINEWFKLRNMIDINTPPPFSAFLTR